VFVEEVGVQPGEGAVGAFSFGRGYGRIEGVVQTLRIALTLVKPQVWKPKLGAPRDKVQSVSRARQLMPSAAGAFVGPRGGLLDGLAEAAMIALYGCLSFGLVPPRALQHVEFSHGGA
jgi:crossover junction endodeoxyribonuclease RuvC